MGLIDPDFALYAAGDDIPENKMKAGFVGAFIHNWDYPYRGGDQGITAALQRDIGEHANYIVVDPFPNDAGINRKYLSAPVDRKIFFPSTNTEIVASMLYLDWISTFENRFHIQFGQEGVNHVVEESGALRTIPAEANSREFFNSPQNIDFTMTINGPDTGILELNALTIALGYAGVDPRLIEIAYEAQKVDIRISKQVSVGIILSEDGLSQTLRDRGDALWAQSISASPADFDRVYDNAMSQIMQTIGNASMQERTEKWQQFYGDAEWLP
jgi:putative aldouronate transport system substrate-binding protein